MMKMVEIECILGCNRQYIRYLKVVNRMDVA